MTTSTITRRTAAILLSALVLLGAAGCGSSSSDSSAKSGDDTSAPAGSSGSTADGDKPAADPCQWYTAAEMEAVLGFPVTLETDTAGEFPTCRYKAPANYSSLSVTPGDEAVYNTAHSFAISADGVSLAGEVQDFTDLGDKAFGHSSKGGADINVLKGSSSVAIAITNGGGGDTAGKIDTTEAALAVAKEVALKVLGT